MANTVVSLSEIPTLTLLYKLNRLHPVPSPSAPSNPTYNSKIGLIRNDITKLHVDSIVNAANESLLGGGGVDGAIHRAAGPDLLSECEKLDGCATGSAKITNAYHLPCKKVIHAVGPVYHSTKRKGTHTSLLQGCYRRSLELAVQHGLKSITFSAISTGVYGYPSVEAAETAVGVVREFLDGGEGEGLERIVFCNFLEKDEDAYIKVLPRFFPPASSSYEIDSAQTAEDPALANKLPDTPTSEPQEQVQTDRKKHKATNETDADTPQNDYGQSGMPDEFKVDQFMGNVSQGGEERKPEEGTVDEFMVGNEPEGSSADQRTETREGKQREGVVDEFMMGNEPAKGATEKAEG